jgi:hypothetical protein
MGLLTIDKYYRGSHYLKIPNYSIQTLYWDYLAKIIAEDNDIHIDDSLIRYAINELAYNGNLQPYVDYLSKQYFNRLSNRDLIHFDEKYLKLILLSGFLLNDTFTPVSEKEVENGYIDIFLQRNNTDVNYEWGWELKYVRATDNETTLHSKKAEAVAQLQKYKQAAIFKGKTNVKFAAIIFIGKDSYEICELE